MFIFNEEEKKKIKDSMHVILQDLREFIKIMPVDKIKVYANIHGVEDWGSSDLVLENSGSKIYLEVKSYKRHLKKNLSKGNTDLANVFVDYPLYFAFINNYEEIRKELEIKMKRLLNQKGTTLNVIDELNNKYNVESSIEIDLPDSLNRHEIKVEEVDGKKVGTIDFGNHLIKIITSNDIVLVNEDKEKNQIKRKIK